MSGSAKHLQHRGGAALQQPALCVVEGAEKMLLVAQRFSAAIGVFNNGGL